MLAGDVRQVGGAELLERVVVEQLAGDLLERGVGAVRKCADADVDVVALGEEPAVAAGEWSEVEDEVVGRIACGELRGQRGVGDGGFECEATRVPGGLCGAPFFFAASTDGLKPVPFKAQVVSCKGDVPSFKT